MRRLSGRCRIRNARAVPIRSEKSAPHLNRRQISIQNPVSARLATGWLISGSQQLHRGKRTASERVPLCCDYEPPSWPFVHRFATWAGATYNLRYIRIHFAKRHILSCFLFNGEVTRRQTWVTNSNRLGPPRRAADGGSFLVNSRSPANAALLHERRNMRSRVEFRSLGRGRGAANRMARSTFDRSDWHLRHMLHTLVHCLI